MRSSATNDGSSDDVSAVVKNGAGLLEYVRAYGDRYARHTRYPCQKKADSTAAGLRDDMCDDGMLFGERQHVLQGDGGTVRPDL